MHGYCTYKFVSFNNQQLIASIVPKSFRCFYCEFTGSNCFWRLGHNIFNEYRADIPFVLNDSTKISFCHYAKNVVIFIHHSCHTKRFV